jgi:hypothetical protein
MMSSHSVELAEAGLEQELYAQNNNDWNPAFWTTAGGVATGTLTGFTFENGATGSVNLTVTGYATTTPVFTSEAFVTLPNGSSQTVLKRQLQATGQLATTFPNALGATTSKVTFNAGGVVDSYDSSKGAYGAQVGNPQAANTGYSAVVLSELVSPPPPSNPNQPGVLLTTGALSGYVIGVSSNPVSYSNGADIIGPNTPPAESIDPSRIITESQPIQPQYTENLPNNPIQLPDLTLTGSQSLSLGNHASTAPVAYTINNLTLTNSSMLKIKGPVILVVTGNLSISGSANITVTDTTVANGGPYVSLEMHVVSGNMSIDGNGIINNAQSPERLLVIGTSNTTGALDMTTATPFYGVMDFPNNTLTIGSSQQIYGALVAGSITFNGSPGMHYDMHLQSALPLVAGPPSLLGPTFNAFQASSQGATSIPPYTISQVVEVAAQ